jgi:hypothetical protein
MVEVLRRGTPPCEYVYESTCSTCKSLLRFKRTEASTTGGSDLRDPPYLVIACPVCGGQVYADPGRPMSTRSPTAAPSSQWGDR